MQNQLVLNLTRTNQVDLMYDATLLVLSILALRKIVEISQLITN